MTESVLVFPKSIAPNLPSKGFFYEDQLLPLLLSKMEFMERGLAEHNFTYKQFITYSILRHDQNILRYKRTTKATESRLHGLYSIGWGGHVNTFDNVLPLWDDSIITQTAQRELKEEINIKTFSSSKLVGFINDDSTEVGQVHFGIVYEYWLDEPSFGHRYKQGHEQVGFIALSELINRQGDYEGWSQILINEYLNAKDLAGVSK